MISDTKFTRSYGSGTIQGYRFKDAAYVDQAQSLGGNDFEYFLITK